MANVFDVFWGAFVFNDIFHKRVKCFICGWWVQCIFLLKNIETHTEYCRQCTHVAVMLLLPQRQRSGYDHISICLERKCGDPNHAVWKEDSQEVILCKQYWYSRQFLLWSSWSTSDSGHHPPLMGPSFSRRHSTSGRLTSCMTTKPMQNCCTMLSKVDGC